MAELPAMVVPLYLRVGGAGEAHVADVVLSTPADVEHPAASVAATLRAVADEIERTGQ